LGFSVTGKVAPESEKPAPAIVAELTVTDAVPVDERVTVCESAELTDTLPKLRLEELKLSVGVVAFNCSVKDGSAELAFAVRVTVCAVDTAEMVAEKVALAAPARTVKDAGTVTAVLLLARLTANPPLAAAALRVTVQVSVPAPVMEELAQESPVSTGTPVPVRLTTEDAPLDELLASTNVPVAAPALAGSNCTVTLAVWFGFSVSGKVAPESEKPAPATVAELTVTAAVPVEESVIDCEVAELTLTLPKLRLEELTARVGTAALSCRAKACDWPPAVAVRVTVWAVETAETVAEKLALAAPEATVTEAGTTTDELLLARFTVNPLAAAAFKVTEHESVPAPVKEELVQAIALKTGTPVPERVTTEVAPLDELLATVSVPLAAPELVGSN
jgi:hypothetical protein